MTWDESVPMHLQHNGGSLWPVLIELNDLMIDRHVILPSAEGTYEIHRFSDASKRTYSSVMYLKCSNVKGNI